MNRIIVIDTNVLLTDPYALFAYADAEIIVAQTVLAELDKIKMGRSDYEVRFRGREVSRTLFDLSQYGSLLEGIELDNGAKVRVAQHDPNNFPPTLNQKNGDDRILGIAWRLHEEDGSLPVTLITNDLNMLLKAQSLGIEVQRHEQEYHRSRWNRLFAPLKKRRFSLSWILVPLVLIGLFISLWLLDVPSPISPTTTATTSIPGTTSFTLQEAQLMDVLKKNDQSYADWFQLGQLYLDWAEQLQSETDFEAARNKRLAAVDTFKHTLQIQPDHSAAKTSLGTAYFFLGNFEEAISQYVQSINQNPNYSLAHFNLAFVLFNQRDYNGAAQYFHAYLEREPSGPRSDFARERLSDIDALERQDT